MFRNVQAPPPPPPIKPKNNIKAGTIIPVIIIIGCLVGALYFSGFFDDFADSMGETLTPTRDIEGTWQTTLATEFILATDYDDFENLKDVGTEDRTMTWTINPTDNENIVYVNVEFTVSNRQVTSGSGFMEDVSPMQLTGIINGTQLTLTKEDSGPIEQIGSVGVFTFTSSQMEGTWHDHWSGVYEQNVYTTTNGLKLMKQ
jgi:hypothetical protein